MINGLFVSGIEETGVPGHCRWNTSSQESAVVVQQPRKSKHKRLVEDSEREWKTSLIGCGDDFESFLLSVFCPLCVSCDIASRIGENNCIAIVPGGLLALRTRIRTKKNIKGTMCGDCMIQCCLCQLSVAQMYREVKPKERPKSEGWTMEV
ncbi:cornifelin homolog [Antedon mediterranea]|uniref:cornifelin homolog n=1 Tax=Antedon mediterranea TaxID=105859 RepID=UPI003AF9CD22